MKLTVVDIIKQMRLHCADIDEIFFCRNGWLNEKQGELIKSIKVKTGKDSIIDVDVLLDFLHLPFKDWCICANTRYCNSLGFIIK